MHRKVLKELDYLKQLILPTMLFDRRQKGLKEYLHLPIGVNTGRVE
jgi:hypothetical protein